VHGARGEADAALDWLDRAHAEHDSGLDAMKLSPHFRLLHGDPRWAAFLERWGWGLSWGGARL